MKQKSPIKYLLVDDLSENLLALEVSLRCPGVQMITAQSGPDALEALLEHEVALAIVDVQMPEMDGFELATIMRGSERTKHIPIIFLTAGLRDQQKQFAGYEAGAVDFLFKPFEPSILRHKVAIFTRLYEKRQALQAALRLNEELVAIVSHDLRTPLASIMMAADMLHDGGDPQTQKLVQSIKGSGHRISSILQDLLDLSRSRLGDGIPIERAHIDLIALVRRIVAETELSSRRAIRVNVVGQSATMEGYWDGPRLEQVVSNLLSNSVKHGSADAPIDVFLEHNEQEAEIRVRNGGAIPADILPVVFEPFRTKSRKPGDGVGLGLYIVEQIVVGHGGKVSVRSTAEEGTTFFVLLPKEPEAK